MDTTHSNSKPADSLLEAMLSSLEPLVNTPSAASQTQADPYAALDPDSIFALTPQAIGSTSSESPYIAVKPGDTFLSPDQKNADSINDLSAQGPQPNAQQVISSQATAYADPEPLVTPAPREQAADAPLDSTSPLQETHLPLSESSSIFPSPLRTTEISSSNETIPLRPTTETSGTEALSEDKKRTQLSRKSKSPRAWLIPFALLFTILLLGALIYGLFKIFATTAPTEVTTDKHSAMLSAKDAPVIVAAESTEKTATPAKTNLQETAEGFLKAESWQDRLAYCRDPQGDLAEKMEQYYRSKPYRSYDATINTRALRYENFTIIYLWDDENLPSDKLIIEKSGEEYLIDWEAFVVLQSMPWEDISKNRPTESQVVRVRLKRLQNDHPTLTYAKGHLCYDIIHPTRPDLTFKGYFKKPSETSKESNDGLYTISISCHADATDSREVMIDSFISKGWVIKK